MIKILSEDIRDCKYLGKKRSKSYSFVKKKMYENRQIGRLTLQEVFLD